jgi:hypothetical protein
MTTSCTVTVGADGRKCGAPAVHTFRALDGGQLAECAEHSTVVHSRYTGSGYEVGDVVPVWRYGREYLATVTKVGKRGAVYATFTYDNGAERTVRV